MQQSIVLGIGSGRCGMKSLAEILGRQHNTEVTYEMSPRLPWRRDAFPHGIKCRFACLKQKLRGATIGDVASSYLPYIEDAIGVDPAIRIICLKQPREAEIQSFCDWLDQSFPLPTNHWARQPAEGWYHEPVWTRTFPQYDTAERVDGIGRYWDAYYATAEQLAVRFPENICVFDMDLVLHTESGQRAMLEFAGIESCQQVIELTAGGNEMRDPVRKKSGGTDSRSPQRCVVLVPYAGQIEPKCERGLTELERRGYAVWRVPGYAAIDQGRNQLATNALVAGFEETMWIDADIGFEPDAVEQLRAHDLPLVCGLYPQKGRREVACHVMQGTSKIVFGKQGGLLELRYGATGFLLVRRRVYETLQQELALPVCNEWAGSPTIGFFQPMVHPHEDGFWYLAEDYAFCQRVRSCGYNVMADTSIRLWHVGKYAYSWEEAGIDQQRFETFNLNLPGQEKRE